MRYALQACGKREYSKLKASSNSKESGKAWSIWSWWM